MIGSSGLLGFVFFEAATIGMLNDPRSETHSIVELLITSVAVGLAAFLFVLIVITLVNLLINFPKKDV